MPYAVAVIILLVAVVVVVREFRKALRDEMENWRNDP